MEGLSQVAEGWGCSLVAACGLLMAVAPLCFEAQALECGLSSRGSGLSCSAACGIFPDKGSNPCPLFWQADS